MLFLLLHCVFYLSVLLFLANFFLNNNLCGLFIKLTVLNLLVAIGKGMWAVKLCSNKILHNKSSSF